MSVCGEREIDLYLDIGISPPPTHAHAYEAAGGCTPRVGCRPQGARVRRGAGVCWLTAYLELTTWKKAIKATTVACGGKVRCLRWYLPREDDWL